MEVPHFALPDSLTPTVARARLEELDTLNESPKNSLLRSSEREKLKTFLETYIYPVLTLPTEITSEVFLQTLDPEDTSPSSPTSPLFLGHICRAWREIALTTPPLWASITVSSADAAANERRLRLLELWLARSAQCPLHIVIVHSGAPASPGSFIETILPHRARWEELDLWISCEQSLLISGELPLLRRVKIGLSDITTANKAMLPFPPWNVFRHAPKLEVLAIAYFPTPFIFPWAQLTSLTVPVALFRPFLEVLRVTVNLEYLSVYIGSSVLVVDDETSAVLPDIPSFPHLHSLVILSPPGFPQNATGHVQLMDKLTVPSLRQLLVPEPAFPADTIAAIKSLVARSKCPLDTLTVFIDEAQLSKRYYRSRLPEVNLVINPATGFSEDGSDDTDSSDDTDGSGSDDVDSDSDGASSSEPAESD
ncbi:hypothetical protein C8R47DRAFT_1059723 [Mycena vitilis]|nr:hypothetical protein C8R47DRAFT_1059723 [Mycena vitilis]